MKKTGDIRNNNDCLELLPLVKHNLFFKNQGISGRDLLDCCELFTYQYYKDAQRIVTYGDENHDLNHHFLVENGQNREKNADESCFKILILGP